MTSRRSVTVNYMLKVCLFVGLFEDTLLMV